MLVSTCKRGEAARGKSVWSFCSTRMAGLGGQSYYNNTLKIKANGGRWVEGGKSLVETTGSLTQTGVLQCFVIPASSVDFVALLHPCCCFLMSSSPFDELLAGVVKSETDARADELRASSCSVEVSPVGQAWTKVWLQGLLSAVSVSDMIVSVSVM